MPLDKGHYISDSDSIMIKQLSRALSDLHVRAAFNCYDSFFNQIDKMNQVLVENGAAEKKIDYVKYIEDAIEKAKKNAPVRKSDVKSLK